MDSSAFALNHMVAPRLDVAGFAALAKRLGIGGIEIRNDLPGVALADGTAPAEVGRIARDSGLMIHSINALYPFDVWDDERAAAADRLIEAARACGTQGIVMCPLNDTADRASADERAERLRVALAALKPMLARAGVIGLVEPLGFAECSLRLKRDAVAAIRDVDGVGTFQLVHDTFHHHVAGETEIFPEMTGLVHISGVVDPAVGVERMRDPHRVLVHDRDLIDNVGQIRALRAGGYRGPLSFEPFAPEVHGLDDVEAAVRASMEFIAGASARPAA